MSHPKVPAPPTEEREDVAGVIEKIERAPYRRLKRAVSKLGRNEPWDALARILLRIGRLTIEREPARARDLARVALFAAKKAAPESVWEGLLVTAECLFADASRRLGRLRASERAFARAARHLEGSDPEERAFFLVTLSDLREREGRSEESLALRARAARLYDALGEVDREAAVLSAKAALELARGESDEARESLTEIIGLVDAGVAGSFAIGAAVSFAALLPERELPKGIAILERVRERYPERAESEEMAGLNLLEGRLLTFGTRPDLAEARLAAAFRSFLAAGLLHDAALAALALTVLSLRHGRRADLSSSAEEALRSILVRELPDGLRAVLAALEDAMHAGRETVTLANAIMRYVEQSEANPSLTFIPPVPRGGSERE